LASPVGEEEEVQKTDGKVESVEVLAHDPTTQRSRRADRKDLAQDGAHKQHPAIWPLEAEEVAVAKEYYSTKCPSVVESS